jgi:hypothetical protein
MLLNEIANIVGIPKKNSMFSDMMRRWSSDSSSIRWKTGVDGLSPQQIEGHIGSFEVRSQKYYEHGVWCWDFVLFDTKKRTFAAALELTSFGRNKRSWQVDRVGVANQYQGMNISIKLYEWLIKQKGLILLTGMSQTAGGKSIWERLAYTDGIFIFGYNVLRNKSFQIDQKDLFNEDIYTDDLAQEIEGLEQERDDLYDSKGTDGAARIEADKKYEALQKKIAQLSEEKYEIGDYVRLVAIKKH